MIVVKTTRGPFRVTDVYYPQPSEICQIGQSLGVSDIIYIRQAPIQLDPARFTVRYGPFPTSVLDLKRDLSEMFTGMSSTVRRQVRKIDGLRDRIEVRRNDAAAYRDFLAIYNEFVTIKRHSERLSAKRIDALKPFTDIFVAYFEGRPLSGHAFIRDERIRRAGLLLAASTRFRGEDAPIFVGSLNRWLHWYEVGLYKSEGILTYDFGGIGTSTPEKAGIANFKLSFGGTPVLEHNYIIARSAGRAAVALFYAIRRIRSFG